MHPKHFLISVFALSSTALSADLNDERLTCSAHFEARAAWGEAVGSDTGYIDGMTERADILLRAYANAYPALPQDWGMLRGLSTQETQRTAYEGKWDTTVEDTMIYFAELSPMSGQAPLCVEDAICQVCSDLLRSIMP